MRSIFWFLLITFVASQKLEAQCNGFVQNTVGNGIADSYSSVIDGEDNVYSVGFFSDSITLGLIVLKTQTLSTGIFVTKIDKNGQIVYAKLIAETSSEDVESPNIAVGANEIMIEGVVYDSLLVSGNLSHQHGYTFVFFMMKLGLDASITWTQAGYYNDVLSTGGFGDIVSDRNGGAFILTNFRDTLTLGLKQFFSPNGFQSIPMVILHIDGNGNILWAKMNGFEGGKGRRITLDGAGNVIIAGESESGIQFDDKSIGDPTITDLWYLFVASFSNDGSSTNWVWGQTKNTGATDNDRRSLLFDLKCDRENNIYFSGEIGDSIQFDNIKVVGPGGMYIAKLNPSGSIVWAQEKSGHVSGFEELGIMALDSNQNIYIAGVFEDSTYLGTQKLVGCHAGAWFTARFIDSSHWDHIAVGENINEAFPERILSTSSDSIVVVIAFFGNSVSYKGLTATNGTDTNSNAFNLAWFGPCTSSNTVDEAVSSSDGIAIFPNPVSDQLNVKFKNNFNGMVNYRIVNELGIVISKHDIASDNGFAEIPVEHPMVSGIYFLTVQTGDQMLSEKFVVM